MPVSGLSRLNHKEGIIFHGTNSGSAITARVRPTQTLPLGIESAIAIPRGIWMIKTRIENKVLRPKLAQNLFDPMICAYHSVPTQNRASKMKISKNE
jgi:hypothetical protein